MENKLWNDITMDNCYTCDLISRRDKGAAPLWDNIYRTPHWDVVHSYNTGLPGWLVLVARRHFETVDVMNDEETSERVDEAAMNEIGEKVRQILVSVSHTI